MLQQAKSLKRSDPLRRRSYHSDFEFAGIAQRRNRRRPTQRQRDLESVAIAELAQVFHRRCAHCGNPQTYAEGKVVPRLIACADDAGAARSEHEIAKGFGSDTICAPNVSPAIDRVKFLVSFRCILGR